MKFKRLNARGFSHHFALVAFVAIFAIAGVGYLVYSRAETCYYPSSYTSYTSYASGCEDKEPPTKLTCGIDTPLYPAYGSTIRPTIVVKNESSKPFKLTKGKLYFEDRYNKKTAIEVGGADIPGRQSVRIPTSLKYTVPYGLSDQDMVYFSFVDEDYRTERNTPYLQCIGASRLPQATKVGSCSITKVASKPAFGEVISPGVLIKNDGKQAFSQSGKLRISVPGSPPVETTLYSSQSLAPGQSSESVSKLNYKVPYATAGPTTATVTFEGADPAFNCSTVFSLPNQNLASCSVKGVTSAPKYNTTLKPYVDITNTGKSTFAPEFSHSLTTYKSAGSVATAKKQNGKVATLKPGETGRYNLSTYKVGLSSSHTAKGSYSVSGTNTSFNCSAGFKLPTRK